MWSQTSRALLDNLPFQGKNCEFGGIVNHGAGLPEWLQKNEKDWPPIHSGEQSIQIILLNVRGFLFDFFTEGLACFELDGF